MKILLVEDNRVLAKSLIKGWKQAGILVEHFIHGHDGERFFFSHHKDIDVIILDLMLPGKSGEEICRNIRVKNIHTPILMLTSKDTTDDTVKGLQLGADDYLTKPFEFRELLARIHTLARRKLVPLQKEVFHITPNILLDFQNRTVLKNGKEEDLSTREFSLLEVLSKHAKITLTRDQIFEKAFDFASSNWSNTIDVHIKNIRKKLFSNEHEDPIKTIRGIGYRLEPTT
jgi:DNA-binding response OmpR family regulator